MRTRKQMVRFYNIDFLDSYFILYTNHKLYIQKNNNNSGNVIIPNVGSCQKLLYIIDINLVYILTMNCLFFVFFGDIHI